MTDEEVLAVVEKAEREAAQIILHAHDISADGKSNRRDLVTQYDRKVQTLLVSRLCEAVEGAAFFCEELNVQQDVDAEALFIIDPIDGTMNFVHGLNFSCVSVAYAVRGEIRAAAVYNPYADEMYTALRGKGAWLNGRKIHVEEGPLCEGVVFVGSAPYYAECTDKTFALARYAYDTALDIRRGGSAELELCAVAAGRAGAFFELILSFWDYAAGMLLVTEAGGVCTTIDGAPLPMDGSKSSVLAAGKKAAAELTEAYRRL